MANSDVIPVTITADTVALDADGISVATSVGNNAALVIGGALASGGAVALSHGRIVTILSAGNDAAKSFTVTGTDVNGDAQTESITGANAGTATGTKYFLTISGISAVGNPAGNVSAGVNGSAADVIFTGRSRLKGVFLTSTATAGTINFHNTSPTGTNVMGLSSVGDADATRDVVIPEEGVVFSSGIYIQYTVSTFLTMTVFHAQLKISFGAVMANLEKQGMRIIDVLAKIEKHEAECDLRYQCIDEKLSDQKLSLKSLDLKIWGLAVLIIIAPIVHKFLWQP